MIRTVFFVFLSLSAIGFVGCQQSSLSGLVPLKGTVFLDDQPLSGAQIVFAPEEGQRAATAISSGDDGKFTVTTLKYNDGIYPGKYRIGITKVDVIDRRTPEQIKRDSSDIVNESSHIPPSPELEIRAIVPERYNDFNSSGLTVEVGKSGQKNFEIRLTSQ